MLCTRSSCLVLGAILAAWVIVQTPNADAQDTFKVVHPFTWLGSPSGALALDAAGNLYGTVGQGGSGNCNGVSCGGVFELKRNSDGSFTTLILHVFGGAASGDGGEPEAGVILDNAGNLYGTTQLGGRSAELCKPVGCGTVFKLAPNGSGGWTESILYSFINSTDGRFPVGGLVFDGDGNLYGTTQYGGSTSCTSSVCGSVFKLSPSTGGSWAETTLYDFSGGGDGGHPMGSLTFDQAGNLYGTTMFGGTTIPVGGGGVVFKLTAKTDGSWSESVLYAFKAGADGALPADGLIFDKAGNLYGMTQVGGISTKACGSLYSLSGCGVVFRLTPGTSETWSETVIHSFNGWNGAHPTEALVFDAAGNLFGTTVNGGQITPLTTCAGFGGCGLVFRLAPSGSDWIETALHVFVGYGVFPSAPLTLDSSGNLYGTTVGGGSKGHGIVFEITP